jgi:anthranilate 1,2-dioxygenase large subunit
MRNTMEIDWPRSDFSRIPYRIYTDPQVYEEEQEKIFRGRTWSFLGLEAEIPHEGDFRTTFVGDTPIVVNRGAEGRVHAFVNRCAHRGATVRRESHGNDKSHICCYHQWCYNLEGNLIGAPFIRGVKGKGGMPSDFSVDQHRLRKLRVESCHGAIFGTFADDVEPLSEFLDTPIVDHLARLLHKPVRVLGYQRQRIAGNWKLYTDNLRDPNHGGLLHMFQITFGIARLSQRGGAKMDRRHRHNISYTTHGTDAPEGKNTYSKTGRGDMDIKLADNRMLTYHPEFPDDFSLAIASVFPGAVFHQIGNSLATRQVRPRGPHEFDLYWTFYGYQDDTEEMTAHRLRQANLAGPGGYISMEDGEAIELIQKAIVREDDTHSFVEIGGRGEIKDQDNLVTEVPMRGFWSYYCDVMGIEAGEAAR